MQHGMQHATHPQATGVSQRTAVSRRRLRARHCCSRRSLMCALIVRLGDRCG
jgi:hypothetical protein